MPTHRRQRDAQRAERRRTREEQTTTRRPGGQASSPAGTGSRARNLHPDERQPFTCAHCGRRVELTIGGGHNRNHCPSCLYSLHVDDQRMGDRASECGGLMAPVGRFERPDGEDVIVHRCLRCAQERHNRVAADDTLAGVRDLPVVPPRQTRRGTAADAIPPVQTDASGGTNA